MKRHNFAENLKNAMGTVFLLAGAFFVCSTLVSMRAVLADPVAPAYVVPTAAAVQSPRNGANVRSASARPVTSRGSSTNVVSRETSNNTVVTPRGVSSRATVSRGTVTTPTASRVTTTNTSRATVSSSRANPTVSRATATASRGTPTAASGVRNVTARNVVSRGTASNTVSRVAANTASRTVRSRAATTTPSRISLQGSAIRGSKAATNTYTYLSNALYTGNYSNIIDSSTGLISAEAYNNCKESYYACMDEICTARNAAQRRCACAGRVRAFADAEAKLEQANEELIKVSGELALLIATKGKAVTEAFQLTDAEKVMNCISWKEVTDQYGVDSSEAEEWCFNHGMFDGNGGGQTPCNQPSYCSESGNTFGFDLSTIDGSSSDILASLQSWAKAKENTLTILTEDNDSLASAFDELTSVVGNLAGIDGQLSLADKSGVKDSLAETWGYELFQYAHNNVCNRVLDSCFNGIYEACGLPANNRKCGNGRSQCPYNYNSYIDVNNTDEYNLEFITPQDNTASNSATCFGYTTASGDPYADLRGPVADARRSIMQQYALDANADCDLYGEQLSTAAQNIGYQKVAAQQALQQKRLEFYQEEQDTIASDYAAARSNFNECLSELYDCYTTQETSQPNWSTSRIKTYCSQVSNVPHCYEEMICGAPNNVLQAVINKEDTENACDNTTDYDTNTCRNIITLSEILDGGYALGAVEGSSVALREQCLQDIDVEGVRSWRKGDTGEEWASPECPTGTHNENGVCVANTRTCSYTGDDPNAAQGTDNGVTTWMGDSYQGTDANGQVTGWGPCVLTKCVDGYVAQSGRCQACPTGTHSENNACVSNVRACTASGSNVTSATQTWNGNGWGECTPSACASGYVLVDGVECVQLKRPCTSSVPNAATAYETWDEKSGSYGPCTVESCGIGYILENGKCTSTVRSCELPNVPGVATATQTWNGAAWGTCTPKSCEENYTLVGTRCVADTKSCTHIDPNVLSAKRTWTGTDWSACIPTSCAAGYVLQSNACVQVQPDEPDDESSGAIAT